MDLSQYAELFLAESREHLTACNQLLLEWEKHPSGLAPVGGLFRAVHTVKGMAATMGYARVTDLAHRMESLLDLLRRGAHPATDELLQLLFRARDALEHAVELSVVGRERELEVAEIVADLDHAASRKAPARCTRLLRRWRRSKRTTSTGGSACGSTRHCPRTGSRPRSPPWVTWRVWRWAVMRLWGAARVSSRAPRACSPRGGPAAATSAWRCGDWTG